MKRGYSKDSRKSASVIVRATRRSSYQGKTPPHFKSFTRGQELRWFRNEAI